MTRRRLALALILSLALFPAPAKSDGIIETIAGTGLFGYSGDGGPASDALRQVAGDFELQAVFKTSYNVYPRP